MTPSVPECWRGPRTRPEKAVVADEPEEAHVASGNSHSPTPAGDHLYFNNQPLGIVVLKRGYYLLSPLQMVNMLPRQQAMRNKQGVKFMGANHMWGNWGFCPRGKVDGTSVQGLSQMFFSHWCSAA